jgi:Effector-associated domain 11
MNNVIEMVGKDDLDGAINSLCLTLKNSPKLDEAIMQSARLTDIMKQIRLGIVDHQQANLTKNQIRFGILDLVREIELCIEENPNLKEVPKNLQPIKNVGILNQYGTISGGFIAGKMNIKGVPNYESK